MRMLALQLLQNIDKRRLISQDLNEDAQFSKALLPSLKASILMGSKTTKN